MQLWLTCINTDRYQMIMKGYSLMFAWGDARAFRPPPNPHVVGGINRTWSPLLFHSFLFLLPFPFFLSFFLAKGPWLPPPPDPRFFGGKSATDITLLFFSSSSFFPSLYLLFSLFLPFPSFSLIFLRTVH